MVHLYPVFAISYSLVGSASLRDHVGVPLPYMSTWGFRLLRGNVGVRFLTLPRGLAVLESCIPMMYLNAARATLASRTRIWRVALHHCKNVSDAPIIIVIVTNCRDAGLGCRHAPGGITMGDVRSPILTHFAHVSRQLYASTGCYNSVGVCANLRRSSSFSTCSPVP
jgi:hypothetical protein